MIKALNQYNLLLLAEVDSTNNESIRLIKKNINDDYIIIAKTQIKGRGRSGKEWQSMQDNLLCSIVLDRNYALSLIKHLPFVTALAVSDAIDYYCELNHLSERVELKWPNDIMLTGRKLAGILIESINYNNRSYAIIGIGVNSYHSPDTIDQFTTNLKIFDLKVNNIYLINKIIKSLEYYLKIYQANGFSLIRQIWLQRAYKLGQPIKILCNGQSIDGLFSGISKDGNIEITLSNGQIYISEATIEIIS